MQLSPTAESFKPVGMFCGVPNESPTRRLADARSGAGYLTTNAHANVTGTLGSTNRFVRLPGQSVTEFGHSGRSQAAKREFPAVATTAEQFGTERGSRAFVIENVPANLSYMSLAGFFNVSSLCYGLRSRCLLIYAKRREFGTLKGPVLTELSSMGKIYVSFTDSREAKAAMEKVHLVHPEWRIIPITAREYVQHFQPSLLPQTSDFEGQLLVSVYFDSRNPRLNQVTVSRSLETLAMTFGDIKSFYPLPIGQGNVCEFHIEFFDTRHAENAMTTLNGTSVDVSEEELYCNFICYLKYYEQSVLT